MSQIQRLLLIAIGFCVVGLSSGCGNTRTVLIASGDPVQLAEPVQAYVYTGVDGKLLKSENPVTIPEAWWCLPAPKD